MDDVALESSKNPPYGGLFCRDFRQCFVSAGQKTSDFVWMNDVLFCCFCCSLLERSDSRLGFGLPFFDKGFPIAIKGFYVGFKTGVQRRTAMIFPQIFNSGVFIWHIWRQYTEKRAPRQPSLGIYPGKRLTRGSSLLYTFCASP
jgi:hypothetical protein